MTSEPFIGIDFGTCNSTVAWFNPKTGQAETLLNAEDEHKTPSVVYFGQDELLVGKYAEERLQDSKERTHVLTAVKRHLAKNTSWFLGGRDRTPVEAATAILKKLKHDAEERHFHDEKVKRAVITCPVVFDEFEKDKLREIGTHAGFQDVELLDEPVAAAIAYSHGGMNVGRYVLVYDLGGGTFDLALLAREGEVAFRLVMEPRGERIGGEDFDRAIYEYFDRRIQKVHQRSIYEEGLDLHLLRQCRKWKENLSISDQARLSWWIKGVGQLELPVRRSKFEKLIKDDVERTVRLTQSIREEAVAAGHAPSSVILIGGSSRIPLISRRLQETMQVQPRKWQKQDVAVALGAAYYAQQLWGPKPGRPTIDSDSPPPLWACPKCGFSYGWDGTRCSHCRDHSDTAETRTIVISSAPPVSEPDPPRIRGGTSSGSSIPTKPRDLPPKPTRRPQESPITTPQPYDHPTPPRRPDDVTVFLKAIGIFILIIAIVGFAIVTRGIAFGVAVIIWLVIQYSLPKNRNRW